MEGCRDERTYCSLVEVVRRKDGGVKWWNGVVQVARRKDGGV